MAWPLVELSGLLDPNVYVPGYVPTGADVGADISQNLNKINEVVVGANELDTRLVAEIADGDAQDILIASNAAAIQYNANTNSTQAAEISALEGVIGAAQTEFSTDQQLTPAEMLANQFYIHTSGTAHEFNLPGANSDTQGYGSTPGSRTIINRGVGVVTVNIGASTDTSHWTNGTVSQSTTDTGSMKLTIGESITVYPVYYGESEYSWALIAGKTYSDLET